MSNNLYMAFHPGDYLTDTAHLSTLEHGAYLLLIMNYWQRGEPLPLDDKKLRGITRLTAAEWAESRETLLEFFVERDAALHHKRIDEELERARTKSSKARASAEHSHNARRANAMQPKPVRAANQDQDQVQVQEQVKETDDAVSKAAPAVVSFEQECRDLLQLEPVVVDTNFYILEKLVSDGVVTPDDVKAGIRAAMERPNFRIRHWSQLEGWARGAAKDRLAGKSKQAVNGHRSSVTPDKKVWLPQGSAGYEAWRTAFPGTVKAILTSKGAEQGIYMQSEFPPANGAAA